MPRAAMAMCSHDVATPIWIHVATAAFPNDVHQSLDATWAPALQPDAPSKPGRALMRA